MGRIINISSVHGLCASPFKSAYVSAKHGLEGLSKVVVLDGGPHGVTSNCIFLAYARTPLVEGKSPTSKIAQDPRGRDDREGHAYGAYHQTLIEPEEAAELAAFLCAPEAFFINDASLTMDGGWLAR